MILIQQINNLINESINNSLELIYKTKFSKDIGSNIGTLVFYGTNESPDNFKLDDNYERVNHEYDFDLPDGLVFFTNDINEAIGYGKYVIPAYIPDNEDTLTINVDSSKPSQVFDNDLMGYGGYNMYSQFINGGYSVLQVKGYGKSTYVTYPSVVVLLTSWANEVYFN